MRSLLRITAIVGVAVASLAVSVWGVSSLIGARSDLRANSPMQLEKRVALAGPYGALANAADIPGSPQVAGLLFEPKALAPNAEAAFAARESVPFGPGRMIVEHPHIERPVVANSPPLPLPPADVEPARDLARAPAEPHMPRAQARNDAYPLPDVDRRTAVYDISARTVYLPSGRKLEAHSGLGDKMDDPRFVSAKNRGPTPPNVYELSLREEMFHGVRAIRLTPVDDGKMFGRAGILAHSYMLGPKGQSNGCVSFDDYPAFLQAFLKGEVERMVVVTHLSKSLAPALMSMRQGRERYY